ncbi:MAG: PAS domain S-box protein, partial [Thiohalobacterales bacterium]|nr:PAS domain S-box protein [Thiohalobacterales bacterium]
MSFRLKTIIGIALIEGVLLLILVLSGIAYLTESSEEELALRARVTAESMANLTRDAVLSTDLARLDSVARRTLESPDIVYVRIMDSERVLAEAGSRNILERPFAADVRLDDIDDGVFDAGVDIVEGDYAFGRVELGLSVDRVTGLIAAARRHLSGIAVIEMMLVALFSFILGSYLTRGLERLAHAARAITDGELGTQVSVRGDDELAQTGDAFNSMSLRLAESQQSMERSIDESKALARRLAEEELRLSTILDTAVDGFVTIDEHGIIDSVNPAAARLFGYQADELAGKNVSCLMPEPYRGEHDGYLQRYLDTGEARVIGTGRRVTGQRRDGSTFPMDLAISEMQLGERRLFVGLVRDLTEKERVESAARRSEAMRTAVVDANLDGLVTIDAGDHIVEFSPVSENIFGYRREDVMGKRLAELIVPPEMRDMHASGMRKYLETGKGEMIGNRTEVPALRADGERFPAELTVQPIEVDGEIFFTAMIRDISDRKAQEAALVDAKHKAEIASEAKSRFLAHMSHEIRSPMNAVLGSLDLLLDDELSGNQRLYARTAQSSGKVLLSLINDILDFSKIEAGQLRLSETDFDVHELVGEAMDLIAFRARDKALPVIASVAPGVDRWLRGDMSRLRQILVNLLDNALKFTRRGGVVLRVERRGIRADGMDLRFMVEDTGIGIPRESQEILFEEFRQVDSSDTTQHGGTGLGLSICKALIGLMGGEIGVDSLPGRGSRFWFDVPLQAASQGQESRPERQLELRAGLAIGFDPLITDALAGICGAAGCSLEAADRLTEDVGQQMTGIEVVLVDGRLPEVELDTV